MSDWFDKYLKVNITAKLTMIASVAMSWRCAEWFMNLEEPTTQQSAFVSVIMGVMTGVYGLYLGKEEKEKLMPDTMERNQRTRNLLGCMVTRTRSPVAISSWRQKKKV